MANENRKRYWSYVKHKDRKYNIDDEFIRTKCAKCRYVQNYNENDGLGVKCTYPYPDVCQKFTFSYKLGTIVAHCLLIGIVIFAIYGVYSFFD